jgi:hypothetical protein
MQNEKDILWCVEKALRCERIAAVAGEMEN